MRNGQNQTRKIIDFLNAFTIPGLSKTQCAALTDKLEISCIGLTFFIKFII